MDRTFTRSTRRRRRTLDGQWEFVTDPDDVGVDEGYAESFPAEDADQVPIPCSWNALTEYADYVGPAWYRKTVGLPESTAVRLTFQGVGHDATVYLDGEEIVSHAGGYTPFSTYVRELEAGTHELVIRADNSHDETGLLHGGTDWFPHGGIYREVVIEEISGLWVSDTNVEYDLDGDHATVEGAITVHNVSPTPSEGTVEFSVGDAADSDPVEVGGLNAKILNFELALEDVDRWSPDDPVLYDVVAAVTGEGDDGVRDRIGFREVETDGRDLLLNGDPVELAGVNYRESHPDWGHALPLRVQQGDVDAVLDAGFNVVRCADYPPHPRFLDRCDEEGLLVIEGISPSEADGTASDPAGGAASGPDSIPRSPRDARRAKGGTTRHGTERLHVSDVDDPTAESRRILSEMVQRDANHPAVVAWSLANETRAHGDDLTDTVSQLRGSLQGLDDSRLVVTASSADTDDERSSIYRYADVLCLNVSETDASWDDRLDWLAERYQEKPIVVTEFGAEAVAGDRSLSGHRGSESHQSEFLADRVETFRNRDDVAGFTVWQFCETLSGDGLETPASATDHSGILTRFREPKEAYRTLQQSHEDQ